MKITYSEQFLSKTFANKIVSKIDNKDFMDSRNIVRSTKKVFEDNLKGKYAEIALANSIYVKTGLESSLDFEIYDLGVGDSFDVIVGEVSIDVKASSPLARTILIEEKKFKSWEQRGVPSYLCMISVVGNECNYLFGVSYLEFLDKAIKLNRGDCIPNTDVPLKATNYAIRKKDCYPLSHLIDFIKINH